MNVFKVFKRPKYIVVRIGWGAQERYGVYDRLNRTVYDSCIIDKEANEFIVDKEAVEAACAVMNYENP